MEIWQASRQVPFQDSLSTHLEMFQRSESLTISLPTHQKLEMENILVSPVVIEIKANR